MRRLMVFNSVTLDGYFSGADGDISWAHRNGDDAEWNGFVADNAKGESVLMFGRVTYDLMASYWPTPMAMQNDPAIAGRMNALPKVVFSRTLERAPWQNTTVMKGDLETDVRTIKNQPGPDIAILGSGTIVTQLARRKLIDEFQVVVNPVVLGRGRTMFEGTTAQLKLTRTRTFRNGNVLMCYEPMG